MASGDTIPWSYIAQRVITSTIVADSGLITTTEVTIGSVTAFLTAGQRYRVEYYGFVQSTVAADLGFVRIREDTLTGNQIQGANAPLPNANGNGFPIYVVVEYVAVATANKTFVVTGSRAAGTGTLVHRAGASRQSYITVSLIPA